MVPEIKLNGEEDKDYYKSQKHLGKLFRAITLPEKPATKIVERKSKNRKKRRKFKNMILSTSSPSSIPVSLSDPITQALLEFDFVYPLTEDMISFAERIIMIFSHDLSQIAHNNSLTHVNLSEPEVILGTISDSCSQNRKRKDVTSSILKETEILEKKIIAEIVGFASDANADSHDAESLNRAWSLWILSRELREVYGSDAIGVLALNALLEYLKEE